MLDRPHQILMGLILILLITMPAGALGAPVAPATSTAPTTSTAPVAVTTTVVLEPSKDNTLFESATGALSNGAGQHLFAGTTGGNQIRRALLAFDVAGTLPTGVQVISATLQLNVSRTSAGPMDVTLHRLNVDWGEGASDATGNEGQGAPALAGDATWLHTHSPSALWSTVGGDFVTAASASQSVASPDRYSWSSAGMAADVQAWLDNPPQNFGWIVVGDESMSTTAKRFDSRQHPTATNRPKLTITYMAPPSIFLPQVISAGTGVE